MLHSHPSPRPDAGGVFQVGRIYSTTQNQKYEDEFEFRFSLVTISWLILKSGKERLG